MLLLALLVCLGHTWIVENPGSSVIGLFPRFQWLFQVLHDQGIKVPGPELAWVFKVCMLIMVIAIIEISDW